MAALGILAAMNVFHLPGGIRTAAAQSDEGDGGEPRVVRLARPTWDTGWFQTEVVKILLQRLGYQVEGPVTMANADFYEALKAGEVDMWSNGWFPLHNIYLEDGDPVEQVGYLVEGREGQGFQGYSIDSATAEEYEITNIGDLADPSLAALFDQDGNGRADLVGCDETWSCGHLINHHLEAYGLTDTVEQVQGNYTALIRETIDRLRAGEPTLYYTWAPSWMVDTLRPGRDVVWLETPFPSLLPEQASHLDRTAVGGVVGCANDPCRIGWPLNDIRATANSDFLYANPSLRRLLDLAVIPSADISAQNVRMVIGNEGDPDDIRRHAREWLEANEDEVDRWLQLADPDAVAFEASPEGETRTGGTLTAVARLVPPFVTYTDTGYGGFEVELVEMLAAELGMEVDFYLVDTVAKQMDDIVRGVARVGLGEVAVTASREEIVDFSLPVLDSGLAILSLNEASQSVGERIANFFRAIASSDLPWLMVAFGVAVMLSAHLVWHLERRRNPDFATPYHRGIADSLYWAIVTVSPIGYGDKVARSGMGRLLTVIWVLLGTLALPSFIASITASLAVEELQSEILRPSDLPGRRVATVTHSTAEDYLTSIGVGPVLADDLDESIDLLTQGRVDAVVFDAPVLSSYVSREGAGEVTIAGSVFERFQYGLITGNRDHELLEQIDLALLGLIEDGTYQRLHERWFGILE